MKILKLGTLPEDEIFRGTCHYCKTEFECKRSEGTYEYDQRDRNGFLRVQCPNPLCKKSTVAYKRKDDQLVPNYSRYSHWVDGEGTIR